jgi:hypothetical protein
MSKLAFLGGEPVRTKIFPQSNTIGEEEKKSSDESSRFGKSFTVCWFME